jgi:ferredoxin
MADANQHANEATDEKQAALHDSVASCPEKGLTGKQ